MNIYCLHDSHLNICRLSHDVIHQNRRHDLDNQNVYSGYAFHCDRCLSKSVSDQYFFLSKNSTLCLKH